MKKLNLSKISKEELYKLYLQEVEKNEHLEAKLLEKEKELAEKVRRLEEATFTLAQRNKVIFGKKREINKNDKNEYNEAENNCSKKSKPKENTLDTVRTREFFEKNYTEVIVLDPDEIKTMDGLVKIGEDITYKIESTPAKMKIIKVISNKYFDEKKKVIYQKIKEDKYPHSFCTPSFASEILYNKFILGIPYYRQEKYLFDDGMDISRQNLSHYQMKTSELLKPMYDYLIKKMKETKVKVLHADETTLRVLDVNKQKCYIWLFNTSFYDKPIFIYRFSKTRCGEVAKEFLEGYSGYLISDCYPGYNKIPNVINSYCWVHARRKFIEILDSLSDEQRKISISQKVVDEIDGMFKLEREYRENLYTASEIKDLRNKKPFKEHLDHIFEILENANPQPNSKLEEAINYILTRKESFLVILQDGHLDLSNNSAERGIKPFVMARKNFLFSNTTEGAESSSILFSLIQTAISNGLDSRKYLTDLIQRLPEKPSDEDLDSLLPWKIYNQ